MARIRKGDQVTVLSGRDKGKTGKVLQVWPGEERALVERVNLVKHFERRTQQNQSGGVIEREAPMSTAKLTLSCAKCQRPARISWLVAKDGTKQRICARCKGALA